MLYRVEIANFYSIRDPQVIDLRAAASVSDVSGRLAPAWRGSSDRVPRVAALFGANASGKSNVLKALAFLTWFAKESFRASPEAWMPYGRFHDDEAPDLPTRLAVEFGGPADLNRAGDAEAPQCRYTYEVSIGGPRETPQKVLHEALRYWPPNRGRTRLFERDTSGKVSFGRAFRLPGYSQSLEKILRPNASVISTLAQLQHPFAILFWQASNSIVGNILIEKQELNEADAIAYYANSPHLLNRLNQEIERIDLGIKAVEIQSGAGGPIAFFKHEGLAGPLPLQLESHGTRSFYRIFPFLLYALETGGIAVIDELDLAIHPLVLPEIVRWFQDKKRNPLNAQLWMTCQNASLLEDLTKEEILFCEKSRSGRTTVYSLADVQAVRRSDNYYKKYLGGVYGAVPHVG